MRTNARVYRVSKDVLDSSGLPWNISEDILSIEFADSDFIHIERMFSDALQLNKNLLKCDTSQIPMAAWDAINREIAWLESTIKLIKDMRSKSLLELCEPRNR